MFEEKETTVDMAEIWRQNYQDALDEIRNLRYEINELKIENELLTKDIDKTENHYHYNENSVVDFLG
jgi:FtsZ-binding cell division protein ZapB